MRPSHDDRFRNLWFADDIDILWGSQEEMQRLSEWLEKISAGNGLEMSSDKGKLLVNSIKVRPSTNIRMNESVLEEGDKFK